MRRWTPILLFGLAGCDGVDLKALTNQDGLPPKIEGLFELHQLETSEGDLSALDVVRTRFPACSWGRQTWEFQGDRIVVGHDLLCPGGVEGERYGCSVSVAVEANWDEQLGKWTVPHGATARSRTRGMDSAALQVPTTCSVSVPAGEYKVARIRGQRWRWEMGQPEGTVLRLKVADTDRPDFVRALRTLELEAKAKAEPEPTADAQPEGGQ